MILPNNYQFMCRLHCAAHKVALYYPLANEVAKGYSNATVRPSVWNPIDFQGQRSMSPGQIFTA